MKKMNVIIAERKWKKAKEKQDQIEKKMDKEIPGTIAYMNLHQEWRKQLREVKELFDKSCLVEFGRKLS